MEAMKAVQVTSHMQYTRSDKMRQLLSQHLCAFAGYCSS